MVCAQGEKYSSPGDQKQSLTLMASFTVPMLGIACVEFAFPPPPLMESELNGPPSRSLPFTALGCPATKRVANSLPIVCGYGGKPNNDVC